MVTAKQRLAASTKTVSGLANSFSLSDAKNVNRYQTRDKKQETRDGRQGEKGQETGDVGGSQKIAKFYNCLYIFII